MSLAFLSTIFLRFQKLNELILYGLSIAVFIVLVIFIVLLQKTSQKWRHQHPRIHSIVAINSLLGLAIVLSVFTLFYVCVMIAMRKVIHIATKTIALAAKAIDDMPIIILTPIIQVIAFTCFMIPLIVYVIYIASSGTFEKQYETINGQNIFIGKSYSITKEADLKLWYLFFCLLWSMNFIAAIGFMVIAVASATWYFTKPADRKFTSWHIIGMTLLILQLICYSIK